MSKFLEPDELVKLTGRPQKSRQIEWLRKEGIAFRVSATGHPVVTWFAITGQTEVEPAPATPKWNPRVLDERGA